MKKLLALVRAARRKLVVEERYEHSVARDIFFARLTADLLARHSSIPTSGALSIRSFGDSMMQVLGEPPHYVQRAASHERETVPLDTALSDAIHHDPLAMGWAYQFWNETERDSATTAVSRRGEAQTGYDEISVATQLFTEEYMASFLIKRCLESKRCREGVARPSAGEVLDPACGVGHILVPFLRALSVDSDSQSDDPVALLSRMHGCDIDEGAVEICRVILLAVALALASPGIDAKAAWSIVSSNIRHLVSPWGTLDRRESSALLAKTYGFVVTNPPYIGRRKLTEEMRTFLDSQYPATSMDLCAAFMERCLELTMDGGMIGLVTVDKWLRLKPYEALRVGGQGFRGLYRSVSLDVICELGHRAFSSTSGLHDGVGVCLFTAMKSPPTPDREFLFVSMADTTSMKEKVRALAGWRPEDGTKIRQTDVAREGQSTAFILQHRIPARLSSGSRTVRDVARVVVGLQTSDDRRFVRYVWSVPPDRSRWIVHSKGGGYDRWFGVNRWVLDWRDGGQRFERDPKSGIAVKKWFDEVGWTYTWFANGALGLRHKDAGWSFGRAASSGVFCEDVRYVAFLNSRVASHLVRRLGGKAQLPEGIVRSLPVPGSLDAVDPRLIDAAVFLKRKLVEHDPTEASFSPRCVWDPREQLGIQALLLVVEGILERQVCESLDLSRAERRDLDTTIGIPVAWYRRRSSSAADELWRFIPESVRSIRSLVEPSRGPYVEGPDGCGDSASYFDTSKKITQHGRPLPATSLVEAVSRASGLHPYDVALDVMGMIGKRAAVDARVIAPVFHGRLVALALTELGHQWWGDAEPSLYPEYPELSVGELARRLEPLLQGVLRIPELVRHQICGDSIEEWIRCQLRAAPLRVSSQTSLIEYREGRAGNVGSFRHRWSAADSMIVCDRSESLEQRSR